MRSLFELGIQLSLTFLLFCSIAVAQQKPGTTSYGSPLQMRLCVDTACETLVWKGEYYAGIKEQGGDIGTHYTVEQWTSGSVRMASKSVAPVSQQMIFNVPRKIYLQGEFTGTIAADGQSVQDGVVKWHAGANKGEKAFKLTWVADTPSIAETQVCSATSSLPRPSALEDCDGTCIVAHDGNLGTWTFQGDKGSGQWLRGSRAELTLQEWAGGKVTISREDTPDSQTVGVSAIYKGAICGDLIKGEATIHWPGHFDEKDVKVPWTAKIPLTGCDEVPDDSLRLVDVARTALRFRQLKDAFRCLSRAADLGDMDSRTATGLMYRDGIGTKVSYPDALRLFQQSAIQGDYNAELALSQVYDIGLGVPQDAAKAKDWETRAYNNPMKVAERQRADQQAKSEKLAFLGLSFLVEAMARPTVYVSY